jgi:hypothetical protein
VKREKGMWAGGKERWKKTGSPRGIVCFLIIQKYSNGFEWIRSKDRLPVLETNKIK